MMIETGFDFVKVKWTEKIKLPKKIETNLIQKWTFLFQLMEKVSWLRNEANLKFSGNFITA